MTISTHCGPALSLWRSRQHNRVYLDSPTSFVLHHRVDKIERAQVRLLLEHLGAERRKATTERNETMQADHSAKGVLRSGGTVRAALRIAEELATGYVKDVVSAVSDVAKDVDAFNMIVTDVTIMFQELQPVIDQAVMITTFGDGVGLRSESVGKEANRLLRDLQTKTLRLLEIHRFSFTQPSPNDRAALFPAKALSPQPHARKNTGGKPLAAHWDDMWSSVAVMLWQGDFDPATQADVSRVMLDWFADAGLEVGETSVRDRARQLWQKIESAKLRE